MRKLLRFLVFIVVLIRLLIQANPAFAQTETPVQWEPLFPTRTPAPPVVYDCPEDDPLGWGTVTPDADWLLQCGSCAQSAYPTVDYGIGTPGWTPVSPFPTHTPTPVATATAYVGNFTGWYITACSNCGLTLPYYWTMSQGAVTGYLSNPSDQVSFASQQKCGGIGTNCGVNDKATYITMTCSGNWVSSWPLDAPYGYFEIKSRYTLVDSVTVPCGGGLSGGCSITYSDVLPAAWLDDGRIAPVFNIQNNGSKIGGNYYCTYQYDIQPLTQPTPTVAPTSDSYCNVVNNGQPHEEDDPNAMLPIPYVGLGTCAGIPAFSVGPIGEAIPELTFPGMQICFLPIQFGDIDLYGLTIDLDYLALAMAAIALLRLFLRS